MLPFSRNIRFIQKHWNQTERSAKNSLKTFSVERVHSVSRFLLWLILPVVFLSAVSPAAVQGEQPNIVLISASNLGFSDLGCYGSEISTPSLDRLASEGIFFTQFYSCGNNSLSQTALMTGQYPHRVGMGLPMAELEFDGYRGSVTRDAPTIAEYLRSHGYLTFISGKWGLTRHYQLDAPSFAAPKNRGFTQFFGTILPQTSYFEPKYLQLDGQKRNPDDEYYHTYAIAEEANIFMERAAKQKKPFFLYAAFSAPSWPLHAPEEEIRRYRNTYQFGWDSIRASRFESQNKLFLLPYQTEISPRDQRVVPWGQVGGYSAWQARRMQVYAAQVSAMDRAVGSILAQIRKLGEDENTLIIFLSDSGASDYEVAPRTSSRYVSKKMRDGSPTQIGNVPSTMPGDPHTFQSCGVPWANVSNTPFRGYADTLYEGGIASPCIIHWPKYVQPGKVMEPAHVIDILPTVIDILDEPMPQELLGFKTIPPAGSSLVPLFSVRNRTELMGKTKRRHRFFFWEYQGNIAIRHGNWKLVLPSGSRKWELYNLLLDRTELHNVLAQNQSNPEVAEMIAEYEIWKKANLVENWDEVMREIRAARKKTKKRK